MPQFIHPMELFHKAGHCLSYEQVLQVDTSLAESALHKMDKALGAIIPTMTFLTPVLMEKHTFHATQMAAWQRGNKPDAELPMLIPSATL